MLPFIGAGIGFAIGYILENNSKKELTSGMTPAKSKENANVEEIKPAEKPLEEENKQ